MLPQPVEDVNQHHAFQHPPSRASQPSLVKSLYGPFLGHPIQGGTVDRTLQSRSGRRMALLRTLLGLFWVRWQRQIIGVCLLLFMLARTRFSKSIKYMISILN
jgi:hypothetical protein